MTGHADNAEPKAIIGSSSLLVTTSVRQASGGGFAVHRPALAAEPNPWIACRARGWSSVRLFQEPIGQHQPGSGSFLVTWTKKRSLARSRWEPPCRSRNL